MSDTLNVFMRVLNEALVADQDAIQTLVNHRVRCNDALADHSTIQVQDSVEYGRPEVGALGLINGLVEAECGRRIAAQYDDGKLIGFVEYERAS